MRETDERLLEALERIYSCLTAEIENLRDIKVVTLENLREMARETRGYARLLEETSLSGRLIVEYALELKRSDGQIAVETDTVRQGFCPIRRVYIEEFGVVRLEIGDLCLTWRDGAYKYLFYPDKVEMRSQDEKTAVKLFFSRPFDRRFLGERGEILSCPRALYLHPEIINVWRS
ncbi:MAG: hypothetical protein LBK56_00740 [Gracilibacteraceae bacterium]|jgi:hypothetical protein|nr:hypothetical protein [Gracilibacteraceae bacterium]